ncbi:hypothetical protein JCM10049v2_005385 [Rhodotorula toruloides]
MSAFAVHLDRLLVQLRDLPSSSPPHLTHLTIRLERAYADLRAVGTPAPAELFVRLRGRLQELGEGLKEAQTAGREAGGPVSWGQFEADTRQVELEVAELLERSAGAAATGGRHSRTPSADLPRRIPTPSQPSPPTPTHPVTSANASVGASPATNTPELPSAHPPLPLSSPSDLLTACSTYHICTEGSGLLPGQQSLGSVSRKILASPSYNSERRDPLRSRVAEHLKRAYFEPFEAALSSTASTVAEKLKAWDELWQDVKDAVLPLADSYLSIKEGEESAKRFKAEAQAPLNLVNQTGFDAVAALARLETVVDVLKRNSGAARSETISAIFDDIVFAKSSSEPSRSLVDLVRRVLDFVEDLEDELRAAHARMLRDKSFLSDADLEKMVLDSLRLTAHTEERQIILLVFGGPAGVVDKTRAWLLQEMGSELPSGQPPVLSKDLVAKSLVEMLFKDQTVDFTDEQNRPPPIFYIASFALIYLQNQFQVLVVVACLATLVGTAPPPSRTSSTPPANLTAFIERIWTILQAEIGPSASPIDPMTGMPSAQDDDTLPSAIRIANFADEVISHRRTMLVASGATLSSEEEARLRASVERVLRYEDPVYKLLKSRLKASVEAALVDFVTQVPSSEASAPGPSSAPTDLRTAYSKTPASLYAAIRAIMPGSPPGPPPRTRTLHLQPAKGFEKPAFLREKVEEIVRTRLVTNVWEWMEESWSDVMG